jgi:hypothetical protein
LKVAVVCFYSTYKTVQLVPRPWRTPEGTVNHVSLATMLKGILIHVMENPGITVSGLTAKYETVLQPVALFELLEVRRPAVHLLSFAVQCIALLK